MNKQHVLVTGINGFVGKHLVRELHSQNIAVVGVATEAPSAEIAPLLDRFIACDLTKIESVSAIDFSDITAVIHLAARANQGESFEMPLAYISDNSAMIINLFETVLAQKTQTPPRFVLVSTGAIYNNNQPMPLTETSKTAYNSPYAISKITGEMLGAYYQRRGIVSIVVRPFNHTGPGQGAGFILPDMVKQLSELGESGTLKVGNITTRRDYTDVRDVVKAYVALATTKDIKNRLYNVCSGVSRSGEEIIAMIAKELFGENAVAKTEVDQSRIRPNDPADIFGSAAQLKADVGWQPTIPFEQTVRDYVAWFKSKNN